MPAITFGGVGSGIDVESIIEGLVGASRGPIQNLESRRSSLNSAVSALSDLGSLMSKLKEAFGALDTAQEVGSFTAKSSDEAIVASADGSALPGSYKVSVSQLAAAERRYSDSVGTSSSAALGKTGTLSISVGDGDAEAIAISESDTLDTVIGKINGAGLRVTASAFYDGSEYRIQIRGLDTGEDNYLTIDESGLSSGFGFNTAGNTVENAQNARIRVDDLVDVESTTNKITGAIPGVTLALTATTATEATITVAGDAAGFQKKLEDMVSAYNAVVNKIHTTAGYAKIKAVNTSLRGDSTLRGIDSRLTSLMNAAYGSGNYETLSSIGLQRNSDGTLKLDSAKLNAALEDDPEAVSRVLAGDSTSSGAMDALFSAVSELSGTGGLLDSRRQGLEARATALGTRITTEEERLTRYADMLRKQFTIMDSTVSAHQAQIQYLSNFR